MPKIMPRNPPISATITKKFKTYKKPVVYLTILLVENKDFVTVSSENSTSVGKIILTDCFFWISSVLYLKWVATFISVQEFIHSGNFSYFRSWYRSEALTLLFGLHISYFPLKIINYIWCSQVQHQNKYYQQSTILTRWNSRAKE